MWTCQTCGLQGIRCPVSTRMPQENVVHWMQKVAQQCGANHKLLAPLCGAGMLDLAVPTPDMKTDGLGMSGEFPPDFMPEKMKSKAAN